jgi:hypothetical protein
VLSVVKYNESLKAPSKYLALNPNAKFVAELGIGHGIKARGQRSEGSRSNSQFVEWSNGYEWL